MAARCGFRKAQDVDSARIKQVARCSKGHCHVGFNVGDLVLQRPTEQCSLSLIKDCFRALLPKMLSLEEVKNAGATIVPVRRFLAWQGKS